MPEPRQILEISFERARASGSAPIISDKSITSSVLYVSRCRTRAGIRLLIACLLAKIDRPDTDIRKPYTEIGSPDCYSGRMYDETYIGPFIHEKMLPCNHSTAFLTPCLRNINSPLLSGTALLGKPMELYEAVIQLLDHVQNGTIAADDLLSEAIRCLIVYKNEREEELNAALNLFKPDGDVLPLSAGAIVQLIEQHLKCQWSSRLPVLIIAACYNAAVDNLEQQILPMTAHNAADKQTLSLGDVSITLRDDSGKVVTSYEMKQKSVTQEDVDTALNKTLRWPYRIDNYVFITTDKTEDKVHEYAAGLYQRTGGIEFSILDCLGFLRHFLHLFHRLRTTFLDEYQKLVLSETDSGVGHSLKLAFLALRRAAEDVEPDEEDVV